MNRARWLPWAAVLAVAAVSAFAWLGSRGLNEPDEGRYAEVAREMSLQTDWLIPHLNGVPHFQKPPLQYWVTAVSLRLFGANAWAARLPTAAAAVGTVAATMVIATLLFGRRTGWMSGLILLSAAGFLTMARVLTIDMLLTLCCTAAVAGLTARMKRGSRVGLVVFYGAMGLGFVAKGPVALLFPGAAALLWWAASRRGAVKPPRLYGGPGMVLTLGLGMSWFLMAAWRHPELYAYFLRYEFVDRIATDVHNRYKPFWFFVPVLAAGFLPWSAFVPGLLAALWRGRRGLNVPLAGLFVGWLAVPFVFLSLVNSKLPTYVLPLFPGLSIVLARWLETAEESAIHVPARLGAAAVLCAVVGASVTLAVVDGVGAFCLPVAPAFWGLVAAAALVFAATALRRTGWDRPAPRVLPLAGGMVLLMLGLASQADGLMAGSNASLRGFAGIIARVDPDGVRPVFACGVRGHSLEFYLGRLVNRSLDATDVVLPLQGPLAARIVDDHVALLGRLRSEPSFVVVKTARWRSEASLQGWKRLGEVGRCVLVASPGTPDRDLNGCLRAPSRLQRE